MSNNHLKRFIPLCVTLVMWLLSVPTVMAQITSVSGTVVDELGDPIIGAVVKEVSTTNSTITNIDGEFTLKLTTKKPSIEVTYLGYATVTEPVVKSKIEINMKPQANDLEEVVVVAYGQQKKVTVTGSVAAIGGAELKKSSEPNLSAALSGKLPGLTVIQNSGAPGQESVTMYLRGAATTNGKTPLILVDGIPRTSMSDIDPNEVASISVLKDASSTAVFGVRGANGVILVTTKRGEEGKVAVHGQVQYSMQKFNTWPKAIPSYEYARLVNEARQNDGFGEYATFSKTQLAIYDMWRNGGKPTISQLQQVDPEMASAWTAAGYGDEQLQFWYPNNDWGDILLNDHSNMVQANVNISGGSKKLKYFASAAYVHQGGMYKTESAESLGYDPSASMNRYNLRTNLDYTFNDVVSASLDISTYLKKYSSPSTVDDINNTRIAAITQRPTTVGPTVIDGIWARNYSSLTNDDGSIVLIPAKVGASICDPTQTIAQSSYGNLNRAGYKLSTEAQANIIGTLNFNFDRWVKGLSARAILSFESYSLTATTGSKTFRGYKYDLNPSDYAYPYLILDGSDTDADTHLSVTRSDQSRWYMNFQGQVNYNRSFNKVHNVTGMLMFQRDDKEDVTGSIPYTMIGTAGRFTYNYDSRYLAEVNFGYNGSEQFAKGHRFGFFPAYSLGWVVSNESFMKHLYETGWLTKLKLRASIGKVGNDVLSDSRFLYLDNITLGTSANGMSFFENASYGNIATPSNISTSGNQILGRFFPSSLNQGKFIYLTLLGNDDIHWETAWKQNYAVDVTCFKNFDLTFDYFIEHRQDILMSRNTVPTLGGLVSSQLPQSNFGKVDNKGYEISASYRLDVNKDLNFTISGNFAYSKNKVVDADEVYRGDDYAYPYRTTGFSMSQCWGLLRDYSVDPETGRDGSGFINTQDQLDKYLAAYSWGLGTEPTLGDFIYQDLNGDNTIDEKDQAPIGYSSLLPRITYGVTLAGQAYGFDFSIMLQGTGQMSRYYNSAGIFESYGNMEYFSDMVFNDRWSAERYEAGLTSTHHRLSLASTSASQLANDYYIMDCSYIRLKNVQLGYTIPKRLTKKVGMNNVRIYVSADNVHTWTNLLTKSIDPEQSSFGSYPLMKTYTAGVSIDL